MVEGLEKVYGLVKVKSNQYGYIEKMELKINRRNVLNICTPEGSRTPNLLIRSQSKAFLHKFIY